eukprot:TRINITY_DN1582_c0_g1_i2.p1 TRINITY_DN1582_c0_g1~~TRINITY_DN1582_c0_g1_i2.p1  ORF type:complete len:378 (+),score=76.53 TRINITY_DN1582_c0_g1_i2:81-1136(+)
MPRPGGMHLPRAEDWLPGSPGGGPAPFGQLEAASPASAPVSPAAPPAPAGAAPLGALQAAEPAAAAPSAAQLEHPWSQNSRAAPMQHDTQGPLLRSHFGRLFQEAVAELRRERTDWPALPRRQVSGDTRAETPARDVQPTPAKRRRTGQVKRQPLQKGVVRDVAVASVLLAGAAAAAAVDRNARRRGGAAEAWRAEGAALHNVMQVAEWAIADALRRPRNDISADVDFMLTDSWPALHESPSGIRAVGRGAVVTVRRGEANARRVVGQFKFRGLTVAEATQGDRTMPTKGQRASWEMARMHTAMAAERRQAMTRAAHTASDARGARRGPPGPLQPPPVEAVSEFGASIALD